MAGNAVQTSWSSNGDNVIFQLSKEGPPERIELYIEVKNAPYSFVIREKLFGLRKGNEVGVPYKKYLFTQDGKRCEIILQGESMDIYKNNRESHMTFFATVNELETVANALDSFIPRRGGKHRKTRRRR
jgi:hypothetical protein